MEPSEVTYDLLRKKNFVESLDLHMAEIFDRDVTFDR